MKINIAEKFEKLSEHWHPYIIGELNENYLKVSKLKGEFVWHSHKDEDELFIVISGTLMMEFRDKIVEVTQGEMLVVPKGVEHKPFTKNDEEVCVILVEPKETRHTGEVKSELTVEKLEWI